MFCDNSTKQSLPEPLWFYFICKHDAELIIRFYLAGMSTTFLYLQDYAKMLRGVKNWGKGENVLVCLYVPT